MDRKLQIDTLRGVACLLLVAYHVIGLPDSGLRIREGFLREANDFLAYIRMPLFTFLSGYVYAYRPFQSNAKRFIAGKARRLLIPMLVVGTLFAAVQSLSPGANAAVDNWYTLHLIPYAHFWFVESLFIVFLVVLLLESLGLLLTIYSFSVIFIAASVLYLSVYGTSLFSIAGSIYLLPYFLAGVGYNRFNLQVKIPVAGMFAVWLCTLFYLLTELGGGLVGTRSLAALLLGTASCFLLIRLGMTSRVLASVGVYSYSIYLFHVFFTAFSRIVLVQLGVSHEILLFLMGCIMGITGPMVVEVMAAENRVTNTLFLGKKWSTELPMGLANSLKKLAFNKFS